jgi:hypothetical protein
MITDKLTTFCNATALNTGAAGTYLIGDVVNLEDVRDIGQGNPLYLVINVETTATSGSTATATFKLASDAQAAIHVSTSTVHLVTPTFAVADMVAGTNIMRAVIPMEGNAYEQFIGILQVTGTAAFTAGKVDAFLTMDVANWKALPDGVN